MQPFSCYNISMSFYISLGVVLLAVLIMAFLQLQPGAFSLLCHYCKGKYSKARTSDMTLFFILGVEVSSACLFLCSYCFTNIFFLYCFRPEDSFWAWIATGIIVALAFVSLFGYYRPGRGTKLFISRKYAKALDTRARTAKSRSDAFALGAFSGMAELVFTLPLYILTSVEIMEMSVMFTPSYFFTILYILAPTIPLFMLRWTFKSGRNLAEIQRLRVRDKNFTRFILFISYLTIAALMIIFRIAK